MPEQIARYRATAASADAQQITHICAHNGQRPHGQQGVQNGGYLKSSVHNAW